MDIQSRKNEKAVHMKKLASSSEYRREKREFFCDGIKLLNEAVKWDADIHDVFYCENRPEDLPEGVRIYQVARQVLEAVSPLKTPQDVVFSVGMGENRKDPELSGAVILENIQDPGNVGTMLRTANAFGIHTVILAGNCADPWSPKTIRAGMGAVFRQKISELSIDEIAVLKGGTKILGAALGDNCSNLRKTELQGCAVAIGNEGNGLSDRFLSLCDGTVMIPMRPECESLNAAVAAAVIMWEMAKDKI